MGQDSTGRHITLTRTHYVLIAVVVAGAVVIAAIGFAGSFAAVRDLAERKGFGAFSPFLPIGIDAGIVVLLALDLLLTWIRIPFPLLRQTAWLLTFATIAFNGAAAWPDPLGVGMHAVIPVLFVVTVEAARHAIGRIADITADKHMDGVRLSRWLLAFPSTFRLWRRMKLWELRSYDAVIRMEQDRLVYEARLRARYGRGWRRKAPVEAMMPLRLARYGVPLAETAPAGLAAAGLSAATDATRFAPVSALAPTAAELLPVQDAGQDEHRRAPEDLPPTAVEDQGATGTAEAGDEVRELHAETPAAAASGAGPGETTRQDEPAAPTAADEPAAAPETSAATTSTSTPQAAAKRPPQDTPALADRRPAGAGGAVVEIDATHRAAVAEAGSNAAAIRYALTCNEHAGDTAIVSWLAALDLKVNRGQVYKERKKLRPDQAEGSDAEQVHPFTLVRSGT